MYILHGREDAGGRFAGFRITILEASYFRDDLDTAVTVLMDSGAFNLYVDDQLTPGLGE